MTVPATQDITITRGDSMDMLITVRRNGVPVPLTGATVTGQIRASADDAAVLATFTCVLADQGTNTGQVACSLDKAETALIAVTSAVYDLQIDWPSGNRDTFLYGAVTIRKDVTK